MQSLIIVDHQKSRERVRDLGEVFTPEKYVEEMLDLIAPRDGRLWSDVDVTFFEPCCGHGNIVLPILRRRLEAIFNRAKSARVKNPGLYSIANALNTLWAVDIDPENVETCRERVFHEVCSFAVRSSKTSAIKEVVSGNPNFFAHTLCAISWQISENEVLSALSSPDSAEGAACSTKLGQRWLAENHHKGIDFQVPWLAFFRDREEEKSTPMLFEKAERFVREALIGKGTAPREFGFALQVFAQSGKTSAPVLQSRKAG